MITYTEDLRGEMMVPPAKKLEDLIHLAELCVDLLQQNEEHYAEVSFKWTSLATKNNCFIISYKLSKPLFSSSFQIIFPRIIHAYDSEPKYFFPDTSNFSFPKDYEKNIPTVSISQEIDSISCILPSVIFNWCLSMPPQSDLMMMLNC